jgi:EAL domain-containing protein (putative c-di-GMP-specific phosphodiesterase class I)
MKLIGGKNSAKPSSTVSSSRITNPRSGYGTGAWTGMEALVRWFHPEHGLLAPDSFIGLAETSGLGLALTQNILEQALSDYNRIAEATGFNGYLAINLPATALIDPSFPEQVFTQVGISGCLHRNLVFELTETAMAHDIDIATEILARLRLKGFSLSIDDFGTGYSSFELLHKLPFNELKVEVGFVRAARTDSVARAIVENSIALARQLGIASVAEGVETHSQYQWLKALGCDRAQGYFIGRPMPAEWLIDWARQRAADPIDWPENFVA